MADAPWGADPRLGLLTLIEAAEHGLTSAPNDVPAEVPEAILALLTRVQQATPGGAPLHAQLDSTRKWVGVLQQPVDHSRFGGTAHIRDYVVTQLRLTRGAVEDYLRETA